MRGLDRPTEKRRSGYRSITGRESPVLALGLGDQWEQRQDCGLWLRDGATGGHLRPASLQQRPPFRPGKLAPQQRDDALAQLRAGRSPQQVADNLGVSYWVIA
jgi:hypothetical protein